MEKRLCVPEKSASVTGCICDHKEIRVFLVFESFSEGPYTLGENHLLEITENKPLDLLCFWVIDNAALASPPTCRHLTTGLLD